MIRPAPATQPWPESVNWTAARAAAPWPTPASEPAGAVAVTDDGLAAQDAAAPGDAAAAEPAGVGFVPVPAGAAEVLAWADEPAEVEPDDVAAQPAAEPAMAATASAETAARRARGWNVWFARALKGISFVTFQMTLYPLARLYRVPSVRSWG
jgi:hypothetical protein